METSMRIMESAFLWENQPDPIVVLSIEPTKPPFKVLNATNAYLAITNTTKERLVGHSIMEPFPENESTNQESGYARVLGVMERCVATRAPTTLPIQKYDILDPQTGQFVVRYWVARNVPVFDPKDPSKLICIYQKVQDVTHLKLRSMPDDSISQILDRLDLQAETEEIRRANEVLHLTNNRLEAALQRAEAASKAKEEFTANLSHELKTPLNAILGYAQLLEDDDLARSHREAVEGILSAAEHLLEVTNQVLDCARLENGGLVLDPKPVAPVELLRRCASFVHHICRSKDLKLTTVFSESCSRVVMLDPLRFRQMVLNLLGNAVKFTVKGWVRLEATLTETPNHEACMDVFVSDSGPGIPEKDIPTLFHRFVQVPSHRTTTTLGTGLGLAIVKGIATLMQGEVSLQSRLGEGSTFHLRVFAPFAAARTPPSSPQQQPRRSSPSQIKKNVLIVDDNIVNQKVFAAMLGRAGHHVSIRSSGLEAISLVSQKSDDNTTPDFDNHFDVIFMDRHMPGIDGLEAASRIRALPSNEGKDDLLIYLLTADTIDPSELPSIKSKGIDAVLSKPIKTADLVAAVEHGQRLCA